MADMDEKPAKVGEEGAGEEEEAEECEEDEEEEEVPYEPTEEEILDAELRELGIPTEAELLAPENYPFSDKVDPDADKTGCEAYRAKAKELTDQGQFFMFPIESVTSQFHCEVLDLKHSGLGDKGAAALARCLRLNESIKVLSLVDNWISARGGAQILAALTPGNDSSSSRIMKLDLSENRLGYRAGSMGHEDEDIGDCLRKLLSCKASQWHSGPMRHLILRANYIGDSDMKKIAESLHDNNWLTELDVSYNELGVESGAEIEKMLGANSTLKVLNIEWNNLRGKGAEKVVSLDMSLKVLKMGWCGVENEAADKLGKVLGGDCSLEEVYLDNNRIRMDGAIKIAEGLETNQSLKRLELNKNPLGDRGCQAIIQAIGRTNNKLLTYVDINGCDAQKKAQDEYQRVRREMEDQKAKGKREKEIVMLVPRSLMIPKENAPQEAPQE